MAKRNINQFDFGLGKMNKKIRWLKKNWRRNGGSTVVELSNGGGSGYDLEEMIVSKSYYDDCGVVFDDGLTLAKEFRVYDPEFFISHSYSDCNGQSEYWLLMYRYGKPCRTIKYENEEDLNYAVQILRFSYRFYIPDDLGYNALEIEEAF